MKHIVWGGTRGTKLPQPQQRKSDVSSDSLAPPFASHAGLAGFAAHVQFYKVRYIFFFCGKVERLCECEVYSQAFHHTCIGLFCVQNTDVWVSFRQCMANASLW